MFSETETQAHITRLADHIATKVDDPAIVNAFRLIPRHRFVMNGFHTMDDESHQFKHRTLENTEVQDWLALVYSDRVLMIEPWQTGSPSSSSEPVLMAQMLAALDIQHGMRILEIGTGTGYNAALLATLVGEQGNIVTIDNQAHLTERAAAVLKEVVGERVSVHTGNGLLGIPDHAPYDRIIATASHPRVPMAWLEQLAVGGKLLMNVGAGGGLVLIEQTENGREGHFLEQPGYFMPLIELREPREQVLEGIDMESLLSADFRFFASWALPDVVFFPVEPKSGEPSDSKTLQFRSDDSTHVIRFHPDGEQTKLVILQGEDSFAQEILKTIHQWQTLGKPQRTAFRFTIEADGRQVVHVRGAEDVKFEL